jgi:DNA-binding CsgD family transcriptional regulator
MYFYRNGVERTVWLTRKALPKHARPPKKPTLTARQRELMELVVAGNGNAAVAARLGISAKGVDGHKMRISQKLGVAHWLQALVLYVEQRTLERLRLGSIAA